MKNNLNENISITTTLPQGRAEKAETRLGRRFYMHGGATPIAAGSPGLPTRPRRETRRGRKITSISLLATVLL